MQEPGHALPVTGTAQTIRSRILATVIRIFPDPENGAVVPFQDFNLADFGGQLPAQGDVLLRPRATGEPPDSPQLVWEVVGRVFEPGIGFDAEARLHVRVRARPPTVEETAVLAARP